MKQILSTKYLPFISIFSLIALIPLVISKDQYAMVLVTTVLLYAVLASAWNIIGGMAGQLDLGAGAYIGLGAFTTGTLLTRWNITPWIGMFIGGFVSVSFAILIGLPLFRFKIKELWYALTSSALVEVLRIVFLMWDEVGGPTEKYLPGGGDNALYSLRFSTYIPYFYIILIFLVIVIYLNHRIRNSKLGFSLLALGEDEDAAEVLGVDARGNKLKALMIYSFIVGTVGGLYACLYGFLHPSFFSTEISTEVVILGIVGGMGITYGPFLAAIFLVSFREYLRAALGGELAGLYLAVYAVVLIVVALFQPRGIAPLFRRLFEKVIRSLGGREHESSAKASS
ncbi:MAG: branched-chain amino acid ABC transporter permease [Anaerolineae bacterium]|nr:branched-chain amino acid ABC transporter permease [Anaerolineae bacterium]